MSEVMTIRVDRRTRARLAKLAKATERAESHLVAEAIRSYVDVKEWQIESVKAAIKKADEAPDREGQAFLRKWRQRV
jgi:predicted transcriptional regulator